MYRLLFVLLLALTTFLSATPSLQNAIDDGLLSGSFHENIEALLDGKESTQLLYTESDELAITISKKERIRDSYYQIDFTLVEPDDEGDGAFLMAIPTGDATFLGYLQLLHKIPGKYSGSALLEAVSHFAKTTHLKKIFLSDASELDIIGADDSESTVSLRNLHILASAGHTSWYESKGYHPVQDATMLDWMNWMAAGSDEQFLTFSSIPNESYRIAADAFSSLTPHNYLKSLEALKKESSLFSKHAKRLNKHLVKAPEYDANKSFGTLLLQLREQDPELQCDIAIELDNLARNDDEEDQFLDWLLQEKSSRTDKMRYATILLIQTILRENYNVQTETDRQALLKQVARYYDGHRFTYKRDFSFILANLPVNEEAIDQEEYATSPLIKQAIKLLGDMPVALFTKYAPIKEKKLFSKLTSKQPVRKAVQELSKNEQAKVLHEILFGTPSKDYYPHISSFMKKLSHSRHPKEWFYAYLLNMAILESATILEKSFN